MQQATQIWIKGRNFDTRHLLSDTNLADRNFPPGSALAVFRLAPADYHRFHHPVGPAIVGPTRHVAGEYYTVNPQAVNEDFDVFTTNRRDVVLLDWAIGGGAGDGDGDGGGGEGEDRKSVTVAVVAVGAMLVGSIGWTNANQGAQVKRGQEMGYFAYGGECRRALPASLPLYLCTLHSAKQPS